ncbi:hypothetical protein HMPREF0105_0009 [Bacteroides sp. 3_1_33FAA]|uniref:Uncharacterized protein n=1 Tax=Phocaeicola dorei DSM 17855 TaxID=483217 RepID=B6W089_9BACT|nr:hypothetical protein BACDOR_02968 [Phocaeicola dorei DSM 17855]EEZ22626.1 hypothetical protein HMPREF0105_0009 [Bacteroides sp. 3_1_33FAA]
MPNCIQPNFNNYAAYLLFFNKTYREILGHACLIIKNPNICICSF